MSSALMEKEGRECKEQQRPQHLAGSSELPSSNNLSVNLLLSSSVTNNNNNNNNSTNSPAILSSRLDQLIEKIKFHYDGYQRRIQSFSSNAATPLTHALLPTELGDLVPCGRSNLASASSLHTNSSHKNKRASTSSTTILSSTSFTEGNAALVEPIALKAKPWTYWEERELYIASEDLCCYLNGGINYRLLYSQLITLLSPLLAMWKEEAHLARELSALSSSSSSSSPQAATSTEAMMIWPKLQHLLHDSASLLESQGIALPPSLMELINKSHKPDVLTVLSSTESVSLQLPHPSQQVQEHNEYGEHSWQEQEQETIQQNVKKVNDAEEVVNRCPSSEGPLLSMEQARKTTNPYNWRRSNQNTNNNNMQSNAKQTSDNELYTPTFCAPNKLPMKEGQDQSNREQSADAKVRAVTTTTSVLAKEEQEEEERAVATHTNNTNNYREVTLQNVNKIDAVFGIALSSPKSSIADSVPSNRSSLQVSPVLEVIELAVYNDTDKDMETRNNENTTNTNLTNNNKSNIARCNKFSPAEHRSENTEYLRQQGPQVEEPHRDRLFTKNVTMAACTCDTVDIYSNKTRCESEPAHCARTDATQFVENRYGINREYTNIKERKWNMPPYASKSALQRRMKLLELYRDGGYAESGGKELLSDVLSMLFGLEFDQPERFSSSSKLAFASFKKCIQGTMNTLLANCNTFLQYMNASTSLNNVYLTECLAQHVKPNMKLYDLLKNTHHPREITELSLSHLNLGMRGLMPLLPLLPQLYRLASIDLSHNDLNDDAIGELCLLLECHFSLQTLTLDFNPITNKSMPFLLSLAKMLVKLKTININNTSITHDALIDLQEQLQLNTQNAVKSCMEMLTKWEREGSVSSNSGTNNGNNNNNSTNINHSNITK